MRYRRLVIAESENVTVGVRFCFHVNGKGDCDAVGWVCVCVNL